MKRASYREGVAWIGHNDEPDENDPEIVQGLISVLLLADLFGVEPEKVAKDVLAFRKKNKV